MQISVAKDRATLLQKNCEYDDRQRDIIRVLLNGDDNN